jgi:predicted pyridoxine 5'-phosphate oxidase superfamily flavin-nucleotide-binding protein
MAAIMIDGRASIQHASRTKCTHDGLCDDERMTYHEGELEMQRRAGVRQLADRVGGIINSAIHPAMAAFLASQRFVIVATVDAESAISASLLGGATGFATATNERTVTISPAFGHVERVMADVDATGVIGLLAIDQATRRRIRINGSGSRHGNRLMISTAEVYSNCPQYIRPRVVRERETATPSTSTSEALSPAQQEWIAGADTFFLATAHPQRGADASHRGGPPGFVTVESPTRLRWPDYSGNNMFNSLGNLSVHPQCGLLFVDFARGATLQLRGRAGVEGDEERAIIVELDEVVETVGAVPLRWE